MTNRGIEDGDQEDTCRENHQMLRSHMNPSSGDPEPTGLLLQSGTIAVNQQSVETEAYCFEHRG
jgi:hypothetical protein